MEWTGLHHLFSPVEGSTPDAERPEDVGEGELHLLEVLRTARKDCVLATEEAVSQLKGSALCVTSCFGSLNIRLNRICKGSGGPRKGGESSRKAQGKAVTNQ